MGGSSEPPPFLNAPMAGHKSTQEECRVRNHKSLTQGGGSREVIPP